MIALYAALVLFVYWYCNGHRPSPDGRIYLKASKGDAVPRPFHIRWLIPRLLGQRPVVWWFSLSAISLVCAAVLVGQIARHWSASPLIAALLFLGLPIVRTTIELPVLVDGPALALTALSALLATTGHHYLAALVALVGGAIKEHVPVFAAAAVMSPWPLLGLLAPILAWLLIKPAASEHQSQTQPFAYAQKMQSDRLLDPRKSLLPWGACLMALMATTPALVVSAAIGYALLFVSSDSTRIYQWAAIPVCVQAATVVPPAYAVPLIAAHFLWPWRGDI